jgi:hypothetical protein
MQHQAIKVYMKNQIAHLQRTIRMQLSKLSEYHVHVKWTNLELTTNQVRGSALPWGWL